MIDHTHAPDAASWVADANGHDDFPIQNLPLGVFASAEQRQRGGIAIGDHILDLAAALDAGMFEGLAEEAARAASGRILNGYLALSAAHRNALRHAVFALLEAENTGRNRRDVERCLIPSQKCTMCLPARIGDYTDFYAGIVHARNVGSLLRPDNPLMPNYRHIPIGYHGRSSTIGVSGGTVRRPAGQVRGTDDEAPSFRPSERLDYEVELGIWIAGENAIGDPVPIASAGVRIGGISLLNDWSARDIQAWEYQPLGPFLAKNFATTIAPWIVTAEALAPYRVAQFPRAEDDPAMLPYLHDPEDQRTGAFAINITVALQTPAMRAGGVAAERLGHTSATHLYWTPAQLIAHHASGGCSLRPGDLIGTGTISAPERDGFGSLMEVTRGGRDRHLLANGEGRLFLEDGDKVVMTGRASAPGRATIGFGRCEATVIPAPIDACSGGTSA